MRRISSTTLCRLVDVRKLLSSSPVSLCNDLCMTTRWYESVVHSLSGSPSGAPSHWFPWIGPCFWIATLQKKSLLSSTPVGDPRVQIYTTVTFSFKVEGMWLGCGPLGGQCSGAWSLHFLSRWMHGLWPGWENITSLMTFTSTVCYREKHRPNGNSSYLDVTPVLWVCVQSFQCMSSWFPAELKRQPINVCSAV